jgi:hypothetical protein
VIPPDKEIFEVESRIAARRAQLKSTSRDAGRRAMQKLTSPVALLGAVALGFYVAGGLTKREKKPEHPERRKSDHMKAAKATGIVGTLITGAMWVIRAQYGSPTRFAQAMLEKFQSKKGQVSPRRDMAHP